MNWPKVDPNEPFEDMEKRLGITKETDDVRPTQLGAHPSQSYYCNTEKKISLKAMRAKFDNIAVRY